MSARGLAQLVLGVRGHHREPQPRGAGRDRRRPDRLGEDAALERQLADPHRQRRRRRRPAGRSGSSSRRPRSPRGASSSRSVVGVAPAASRRGCGLARRAARARRARRRPRAAAGAVEKMNGRARVDQQRRASSARAGRVRAVGAERLAERADDDVDLALEPGLGDRAAAAGPDAAGAVGLVDDDARVVARGRARRCSASGATSPSIEKTESVTISAAAAVGARRPQREVLEVAVVVDERLGPRQPAAVDDRGVVELVGEDDRARAGQRADDADVGQVARAEEQRRLGALEGGQRLLEPAVDRSSCPRPAATRRRRRPSASPRRRPPRARAGGRRGRGSCSSRAAARACRRARRAGPAGR